VIVVSDTSPITALLTIGQIEILHALYGAVKIPPAVDEELRAWHVDVPDFIQVVPVHPDPLLNELQQTLDRGEAEAIVLAKHLNADLLLMDEALGRQAARKEHMPVIGLMGVLLIAKKKGLVASLRELIERLESEAGFYLARPVKEQVFAAAGE
jgi:uncharacterized protein